MINLIKKKGINPQTKTVIYFPQWTRVATVNKTQLAERMARGGTFSIGECEGVMSDFPQFICDELLNGNAVQIAGLGTFKLKVSGKAKAEKNDVTSAGAKIAVVFEPEAKLTSRLNDEREFRFVEKPTPEGEQDAEEEQEPENGDNAEDTGDANLNGGGSQSGGGSNGQGGDNGGGGDDGLTND